MCLSSRSGAMNNNSVVFGWKLGCSYSFNRTFVVFHICMFGTSSEIIVSTKLHF